MPEASNCLRAAALAMLGFALGACASQMDLRKEELAQLAPLLPGFYDNRAQAQADAAKPGERAHEALSLVIIPVYAPTIGDHVFFLQETALDDPMRVLAQRVLSFDVSGNGEIVQSSMTLNEPQRWRDGPRNLDLFKSMMASDVRATSGCEMVWKKTEKGFEASNDPTRCRTNSRATGEVLRVESRARIDTESLSLSDRHLDGAGRVVYGDMPEPFYRFQRRAQ